MTVMTSNIISTDSSLFSCDQEQYIMPATKGTSKHSEYRNAVRAIGHKHYSSSRCGAKQHEATRKNACSGDIVIDMCCVTYY